MLGSHNSCTYLPCRKWWMYLINFAAKCQSKTLSQQFHAGVRYFDIRVKWNDKHDKWVLAHGIVEYKGNINRVLTTLNNLARHFKEDIYVRILLEYNKCPDNEVTKIIKLSDYVSWARGFYPDLTFHLVETKWNEDVIMEYAKSISITHKYSSVLGWKRFLWIPWVYAKLHNKKTKADNAGIIRGQEKVLMIDFV